MSMLNPPSGKGSKTVVYPYSATNELYLEIDFPGGAVESLRCETLRLCVKYF
jgi:hypothetical protein